MNVFTDRARRGNKSLIFGVSLFAARRVMV
jgi:hypothetical protein